MPDPTPRLPRYSRLVLLVEDVLLLLIRPDTGCLGTSHGDAVLGGALLSELALDGAVELDGRSRFRNGRVRPVAGATVDDPLLAAALAVVAEKPRCPRDLVGRLCRGRLDAIAERLVACGVILPRETRVLGVFRRRRWQLVDPGLRDRLLHDVGEALASPDDPDARTRALLALLAAAGPVDKLAAPPGLRRGDVRRRARELARGDWAAHAVREAIRTSETGAVAGGTVVSNG